MISKSGNGMLSLALYHMSSREQGHFGRTSRSVELSAEIPDKHGYKHCQVFGIWVLLVKLPVLYQS
jgi:hypothetical protein